MGYFCAFFSPSLAVIPRHITSKRDVIPKFGSTKLPHLVPVTAMLKTWSPVEVDASGFTHF